MVNTNTAGWSSFDPTDEDLLVTVNIVHMGSMTQWCSQSPHCWFLPSPHLLLVYDHYDGCSEEMPNMLLWPWYFGIKKFIFQLLKKYENFFAMNLDMFPKLWAYSRNIFFVPMYIFLVSRIRISEKIMSISEIIFFMYRSEMYVHIGSNNLQYFFGYTAGKFTHVM